MYFVGKIRGNPDDDLIKFKKKQKKTQIFIGLRQGYFLPLSGAITIIGVLSYSEVSVEVKW